MDNEGLLEWAEYEVNNARAVLKRAEMNRDELRIIVEKEQKAEEIKEFLQRWEACGKDSEYYNGYK